MQAVARCAEAGGHNFCGRCRRGCAQTRVAGRCARRARCSRVAAASVRVQPWSCSSWSETSAVRGERASRGRRGWRATPRHRLLRQTGSHSVHARLARLVQSSPSNSRSNGATRCPLSPRSSSPNPQPRTAHSHRSRRRRAVVPLTRTFQGPATCFPRRPPLFHNLTLPSSPARVRSTPRCTNAQWRVHTSLATSMQLFHPHSKPS